VKKVLVLGSGAIRIGQAGEFDYSGSQAIKALKEEGVKTVLINPNIATIQTSEHLADKVYFIPLLPDHVERVIRKERPDGILLSFGGQTGLNVGLQLDELGILDRYNVQVLGTPLDSIRDTEDRERFSTAMKAVDLKVAYSRAVGSVEEALETASQIGYPVMCRLAFALGGLGSGAAHSEEELRVLASKAFSFTPQILIEEYLGGWKEVEYEVVRDRHDNCITVCNMENLDPMGIHTGESIVVAPVQTLSSRECFKLRSIAIKAVRALGVVGECNIQYALDPHSEDYRIIEVNARLSRSSALASKATGYPLAFIAAKLGLGIGLPEIENQVTMETRACFEPALDYVVVKFPRWDLQKFRNVSVKLGTEMKSVGEVMAIGRNFEESLQKAIRMLDIGHPGVVGTDLEFEDLSSEIANPTDKRLYAVAKALRSGMTVEDIHGLSMIDRWYLERIRNITVMESMLEGISTDTGGRGLTSMKEETLRRAKQLGFSDGQIASLVGTTADAVRERRKRAGIVPVVKQIDTLAAEYPAQTNYLYLTYNATHDDRPFYEDEAQDRRGTVVLGGGAYRIGSSVEFDWCCVNAVKALRDTGRQTIMINCNPETVSTDYDECDKLYFEELSLERVLDICEKEDPNGVIVSMGGQIPNNLALPLMDKGVTILGTSPRDIDRAEDRHKFSSMLDSLGIDQPAWEELSSIDEALRFAESVGYPVLVRPSYVLSGAAMSIALTPAELERYLGIASKVGKDHPVVISKFITGAKEIEIDAVGRGGKLHCYAISEHVENAGVHSGDATLVLPPQRTYLETMRRVKMITKKICSALRITGPFNLQFIAKENEVKVIECNVRASRSFPFASKVFRINFIDIATKLMVGENVPEIDRSAFDLDYVGVKAPQFSFTRLKGSDPVLGVEMSSTGEVACMGEDFSHAFLLSMLSTGFKLPRTSVLLSTGPVTQKADFLSSARKLRGLGISFYATRGTHRFLVENGIESTEVHWPLEGKEPNTLTTISEGKVDLVINIPKSAEEEELENDYLIRRRAVDSNVPLITNMQLAKRLVESMVRTKDQELEVKSWDEFQ